MKPFNKEIIKAMAEHSDECAAYASAMMWDYRRKLTVEEAKLNLNDHIACPFCIRYKNKGKNEQCPLYKIFGDCCHYDKNVNVWQKMAKAKDNKDQQAYTKNANDLYFQIRSIIDDFSELKKEEVLYHKGQKFNGPQGEYLLTDVAHGKEVMMINILQGTGRYGTRTMVNDPYRITEDEFKKICEGDTFALIEDKK